MQNALMKQPKALFNMRLLYRKHCGHAVKLRLAGAPYN